MGHLAAFSHPLFLFLAEFLSSSVICLDSYAENKQTNKQKVEKGILFFSSPRVPSAGNKPPAKATITKDLEISAANYELLS